VNFSDKENTGETKKDLLVEDSLIGLTFDHSCHDDKIELIAEKNYLTSFFCNTRNDRKINNANRINIVINTRMMVMMMMMKIIPLLMMNNVPQTYERFY